MIKGMTTRRASNLTFLVSARLHTLGQDLVQNIKSTREVSKQSLESNMFLSTDTGYLSMDIIILSARKFCITVMSQQSRSVGFGFQGMDESNYFLQLVSLPSRLIGFSGFNKSDSGPFVSPYICAIRTLMQAYRKHTFVYLSSAKQPLRQLLLGSYWSSLGCSESAAEPWRVRAPASSLLLCSGRTEDVATTYFISVKMKQAGSIALNTRYSLLPTLVASLNSS